MGQPALPLENARRRLRLQHIDQRLAVLARHLRQHRIGDCPRGCDRLILLAKIDVWLDRRLGEEGRGHDL